MMLPTMVKTAGMKVSLGLMALALSLGVRSDAPVRVRLRAGVWDGPLIAARMAGLPRVTLWAWERREDLRGIDTGKFAVGYLDQTVTIGLNVTRQRRRDPVVFPGAAVRMAVVRVEAPRTAVLDGENRVATVEAILRSAREPGIAALQIDFDATRSQRSFYRDVLAGVRRGMPAGLPLSMTALASWCAQDDWLAGLPVDEAVPMMFRMEPDRRRAGPDGEDFRIREPLCLGSVGVSTREAWPADVRGKRVYVFADKGWATDTPAGLERRLR